MLSDERIEALAEELMIAHYARAVYMDIIRRHLAAQVQPTHTAVAERIAAAAQEPKRPVCPARAWHGPGSQSHTHCTIPADLPHRVHAARYGEFDTFGLWVDDPKPRKGLLPGDAFNPDANDIDLSVEYEREADERNETRTRQHVARVAAILAECFPERGQK